MDCLWPKEQAALCEWSCSVLSPVKADFFSGGDVLDDNNND